jgi:MFS transporter, ACS family, D-galactonate transporter
MEFSGAGWFAQSRNRGMSRRWVLLALIFAGILISYVDRGNLSIAAGAIMHDFNLDPSSMGVLLSAFFWTYAICQIPAGVVVDKLGIRFVYAAGLFIWSLASAGIALSRGAGNILALRLVLGVAESVAPLASMAFIRQNFKGPEQGLPVSIYIAGQTMGPACGALLGASLLNDFGWRALFACTGLGALVWVPVWTYLAPRQRFREKPSAQTSTGVRWEWRTILTTSPFWAMSACVLFFSYYWYFLLTWMPAYLTIARGYSTMGMGQTLSAPLFAMAVVNVLGGLLADKLITRGGSVFGVRLFFLTAGLLGASAILFLDVIPGRGPVLPILVLSICSFGLASSNFWAIAQYASPSAMVGRAIGYLNTLSQIGGVLAPLITGWSLGPHRNFKPAILIAGLCPLVSALLLALAGPKKLNDLKRELGGAVTVEESV